MKLILSFFLEMFFARKEEYDFKSKHFKPGKVIFACIVICTFILNFFLMTTVIRVGFKYVEVYEENAVLKEKLAKPQPSLPDKNQVKKPSDSQDTLIGIGDE